MTRKIKIYNVDKEFEIAFCFCPPGSFKKWHLPKYSQRNIEIEFSRGFWLQETTVTDELYKFLMGKSFFENTYFVNDVAFDLPIYGLDRNIVIEILNKLNSSLASSSDFSFDIPNSAEYEYALMAGSQHDWSWGDEDGFLQDYAWFRGNSNNQVHPVKLKKKNSWGLYDMYGNVAEVSSDFSRASINDRIVDPIKNEKDEDGLFCTIGGAYNNDIDECNTRDIHFIGYENENLLPTGFRLILRNVIQS